MAQVNNPAGRLYEILSDIRSKFSGDVRMKEVWTVVLNIHSSEKLPELLTGISQVMQLVDDSKRLIRLHPEVDQALYLKPFESIEQAISNVNLGETWQSFTSHLDDPTLVSMRFCSDFLSREEGDEDIETTTLMELQNDVSSLLEKLVSADLADELKAYIVDALEDIRQAILGFRINGAEGLKRALEATLGAAFRFQDEIRDVRDGGTTGAEVVDGFWGILSKLDIIVSHGRKLKQLAAPIAHFMLTGNSES